MEITYDILFPVLTFVSVLAIGAAFLVARSRRQAPVKSRLQNLEDKPEESADHDGESKKVTRSLVRFGKIFAPAKASESLSAKLSRAGYHSNSAAVVFTGAKILLLIVGAIGAGLATIPFEITLPVTILTIVTGGALLSFLPNFVVRRNREKRRKNTRNHLPDAVDLLEICVSSGMGLDMAWNAVTDEIRRVSPILADEMALTNLEMHLGATRVTALRNMVDRTGAEELGSLVAVLIQSERFGTSISESLRTFATTTREIRSQKAEEYAEKMAVKLLFPMILFIFPAIMIVVAGPAGIRLVEIIGAK